ncbi:P-loop containing nucleoside triphosphate hydrolase protein [Catenaria anguillulae PL171]|uniref:RNA helicase n=1 Tax=Catenaria anguillulae PL171 TaxID=765915 RepID=A0A1Y2HIH0_9FUNG|nr:P-loop containing nucleoside triphosphate hydrolase protein [Catenaria anguillulae PL171]
MSSGQRASLDRASLPSCPQLGPSPPSPSMNWIPKSTAEKTRIAATHQQRPPRNVRQRNPVSAFRFFQPPKRTPDIRAQRNALPAAAFHGPIVQAVRNNQVVIVAGETGSGKSTQVAQFLLESVGARREPGQIVCAQPRRISAVSLAARVAEEWGDPILGETVGYAVKLDRKVTRRTRLVFCTTGVLLRCLESDSSLQGITHVIVDEVHERSLDSDLLLLLLRRILPHRPDLRVILMSATIDEQQFAAYFGGCPVVTIPGRTFPVQRMYLEDVVEQTGYVPKDKEFFRQSKGHGWFHAQSSTLPEDTADTLRPIPGAARMALRKMDPTVLNYELMEAAVRHIMSGKYDDDKAKGEAQGDENFEAKFEANVEDKVAGTAEVKDEEKVEEKIEKKAEVKDVKIAKEMIKEKDQKDVKAKDEKKEPRHLGSILIFLPGIAEIRRLHLRLARIPGTQVMMLHSSLSPTDQAKVFDTAPAGIRKIVLSTIIAETGVTVPDVCFVIDSGKAKVTRYDPVKHLTQLRESFVTQANCRQRQGRAGRVRPGYYFALYSQYRHDNEMEMYEMPEVQRMSLESTALKMKIYGFQDIETGFADLISPPLASRVRSAITRLQDSNALDSN